MSQVIYLSTYGWQGGAGTWSDGKLVTRIGRNTESVLAVMSPSLLVECFYRLVFPLTFMHWYLYGDMDLFFHLIRSVIAIFSLII